MKQLLRLGENNSYQYFYDKWISMKVYFNSVMETADLGLGTIQLVSSNYAKDKRRHTMRNEEHQG